VVAQADLVLLPATTPAEVGPAQVIGAREDRPAARHPRLPLPAGLVPGAAELLDLLGLLDVDRLAGLVDLQRGTHQVQPHLGGPRAGAFAAAPPQIPSRRPSGSRSAAPTPRGV